MLNEERICQMTKAAIYEKKNARKQMEIIRFYRGDYISCQLIKGIVSVTIAFGIGFAGWILLNIEYLMDNIHKMNLVAWGSHLLFDYVVCAVLYGLLVFIYSWYRYQKAQRKMKRYYHMLKELDESYEQDELLKMNKEQSR